MVRKLIWLPALRRWQDGFYEEIAQICKLDSASSILPIFWLQFTCFCVPSFQDLFVFRLVQNPPPGFLKTGSGAFLAAPSALDFDVTIHWKNAPSHFVHVKRSLISIFWKSRVYLDYSIATDKIGRIELAESSLQIWA